MQIHRLPRRVIRNQRFEEQGGKCYYCKRPMLFEMPPGPNNLFKMGGQPSNLCTLEHLVDRLNPMRWDENLPTSPRRYAAACRQCNNARSTWIQMHTPPALISALSQLKNGEKAKEVILEYYKTHEYIEPPPFIPHNRTTHP